MKVVYISHAISGDIQYNLREIRQIVRRINLEMPNIIPVVPYYCDVVSLDDNVTLERKRGIDNCLEVIKRLNFDEIWLTGNSVTPGMNEEIKQFLLLGKPIINKIGKF